MGDACSFTRGYHVLGLLNLMAHFHVFWDSALTSHNHSNRLKRNPMKNLIFKASAVAAASLIAACGGG